MARAKAQDAAVTTDQTEEPEWAHRPVEGEQEVTGQELTPAQVAEVIASDDVLQSMMDWCMEFMEQNARDNADVMAAEVRRILSGEDAEAVLSEGGKPLNGKDHTEKPFLLHSFTLNPTDFTEGWPFYASMNCTVPGTGDAFVMNCGGPKVVAQLRKLHELGEYPYPVKVRGKQTRQGFTVLSLVEAGA